jgi:hypothetical protein
LAGAVAAGCVPGLRIRSSLSVPDLAGAEVLAGAAVLAGAGVFSAEGVVGAGYSGAAGAVWPAEAGSGIV